MKASKLSALALAGIMTAAISSGSANAAMISFSDWNGTENLVEPIFSVSDSPSGAFSVSVDISSSSPNLGLLSGIFFDLSPDISRSDISGLTDSSGNSLSIINFANDTLRPGTGTGVNMNGATKDPFDVGFDFAKSIPPMSFLVSDLLGTLGLKDWTRVGLRFQAVGTDGEFSDKLISGTVSQIPVPAALPLFLSALGGLGWLAWRRRQMTASV